MANSTLWEGVDSTTPYSVYLGTWTNWSRGRVMGATLTTTRQYGNLFIAFTAFFVSFVASRFWKMACLVCHRYYSSTQQGDALHHQRQAVLRNSGSSLEGLLMLARLAWAWRSSARRCLARMIPAILTAAFFLAFFSIAGGFSSQISSAIGSDVLLDGSNCGFLDTTSVSLEEETMHPGRVLYSNMAQKTAEAANYAQQCYSSSRSGLLACSSFVVDHLSSTVDTQAACPFPSPEMCRLQGSNLRVDTGLMDSNNFFGLNAPESQRMFFRNVLECAPLVTKPFSRDFQTRVNNYTAYNYGPNNLGQNYTYLVETLSDQYQRQRDDHLRAGSNFILDTMSSFPQNGSTLASASQFTPIPELFTDDGDLHLIFLQGNGVYFYRNTTDPWYRATEVGATKYMRGELNTQNSSRDVYRLDEAASPLACIEKYQFCNAGKECGPLAGKHSMSQTVPLFNLTTIDVDYHLMPEGPAASRFYWFYNVLSSMTTDFEIMLKTLGPKALLSQQDLLEGLVGPLPDDQWQLEVTHWWAIRLASIQAAFVNTAYGTGDAALELYRFWPFDSYVQDMCNNQKIKSTDYTSFSLFGLYFTYITGLLIIITSFLLEPIIACLYRRDSARRLKRGEYKYLEWASNGILQLQRLAYQGIKSGMWSGYTDDIPMTEAGALLGDLTASYREVAQDQNLGPGSGEKTNNTATVQAVTVGPADMSLEAATGSSDGSGTPPTLGLDAEDPNTIPGPQSDSANENWGGYGRGLHLQTANLTPTPGSVTPGSGTDTISPVSPLPTQFEPPTLLPRNATLGTNVV